MTSSLKTDRPKWLDSAAAFDALAAEYDHWFTDNPLFEIELAALTAVGERPVRPSLELGVGPGRFAEALAIDYGIDPAHAPLQLARSRGIPGIRAIGEQLPLRSGSIGTVFVLFTLCFLADPALALRECARILKPQGRLIIGMIPGMSPWGKMLERKKRENNPFYRHATLRSVAEVVAMSSGCGFNLIDACSTLFQSPDAQPTSESPRRGIDEIAGFCVLVLAKKEKAHEIPQPDHPDN